MISSCNMELFACTLLSSQPIGIIEFIFLSLGESSDGLIKCIISKSWIAPLWFFRTLCVPKVCYAVIFLFVKFFDLLKKITNGPHFFTVTRKKVIQSLKSYSQLFKFLLCLLFFLVVSKFKLNRKRKKISERCQWCEKKFIFEVITVSEIPINRRQVLVLWLTELSNMLAQHDFSCINIYPTHLMEMSNDWSSLWIFIKLGLWNSWT